MSFDASYNEKIESLSAVPKVEHMDGATTQEEEHVLIRDKKLLRKIDYRVMPWLCILYALSFIDRSNISIAKISGMSDDLALTGDQYSLLLLVFFFPYIATEIPSNAIIRQVGTKYYLSILIVSWGLVAMCCGFVTTYHQMLAMRILLGFFEGGFSPACFYLISSWYKRYETHKRISVWYMSGSLMSGFSGIISYGLSTMNGDGGLRGWRWIFIMPGIVTVVLAIPVFFFIADFPEQAKWLKGDELELVKARLESDRGENITEKLTAKKAYRALIDPKIWFMSSLLGAVTTGTYVMAFFTPSILAGFGYSVALSQILVTPPYILSALVAIGVAFWADRIHRRVPFILGLYLLTIVGFVMIGWGNNTGCKLTGVFLAITGVNAVTPCVMSFLVNNVPNPTKRQIAVGLQTSFAGIGGVIGSTIFRSQDAPLYRSGMYGAFTVVSIGITFTVGLTIFFARENKKADKEGKIIEGVPGFRYTL